jgi:EpsI family protein
MSFLRDKYARVLTLVLLLQAGVYYAVASRGELTPAAAPLAVFPAAVEQWQMLRDLPLEKEVQDVLKADDTLNREYANPEGNGSAYLFVAFFKTQRYGQAPHSPKNCLPGSGWEPTESDVISISVPGRGSPIVANKYVVAYGDQKSVVLYWYHSHNRVIASEYWAKFWLVADAIRYRRSDTALVRIVVAVRNNDTKAAADTGVRFIQSLFPSLTRQLAG